MIYDHTHVKELKLQASKYLPKLTSMIRSKGGIVKDNLFLDVEQAYKRVLQLKNPFIEEYYGVTDITQIYQHLDDDDFRTAFSDEFIIENYNAMKNYMNRATSSYDFNLITSLRQSYDPASLLVILIDAAIEVDKMAFDNTVASQEWLDHNFNYLSKIGFSSNYFYDLLDTTRKGYDRFVDIELSDEILEDMATAAVTLQNLLKDKSGNIVTLKPMDLDDVQVKALENNNASAESFVGYRNLRDDDVKTRVIERSNFIKEFGSLNDVYPFSQLHRIQSGGNVIFDYLHLEVDESTGNREYNIDQLINAVAQIADERGHSTLYMEKEPLVLPELSMYVSHEQLPESYRLREELVNTGMEPAIIMNTYPKTDVWVYNFKVNFPNVFTLIGDKYPDDHEEYHDKIYTKHRSVKAGGPDLTRVVQSYLYPFMDHLMIHKDDIYSSFVSQWAHPDYIKRMITNMLVMINPESLFNEVDNDINYEEALSFVTDLKNDFEIVLSADDKSGFDQFQSIVNLFLYFCTFFSIPFEDNEENNRLFQIFIQQIMFPVLLAPEGIFIYDSIIPSGAGVTSGMGTYNSNHGGLTVQGALLRSDVIDDENPDDDDDTINEVDEEGGDVENEDIEESATEI